MSRYIDAAIAHEMLLRGYVINDVPTADVQEVRHGKWILRGGWNRCSVCDGKALLKDTGGIGGLHEYDQVKSDICPYCGAKMDGKE